jgi:hypothetical protein
VFDGQVLPSGLIELFKVMDGNFERLADAESSNAVVGTNAIQIGVTGAKITINVNGRRVLTFHDNDNPLTFGVGVGAIWEAEAWFDNIVVQHSAAPVQPVQ